MKSQKPRKKSKKINPISDNVIPLLGTSLSKIPFQRNDMDQSKFKHRVQPFHPEVCQCRIFLIKGDH